MQDFDLEREFNVWEKLQKKEDGSMFCMQRGSTDEMIYWEINLGKYRWSISRAPGKIGLIN